MKKILSQHNPWWIGESDPHLEKWNQMKIKWRPKWIDSISLKPFSLNFVLGPRQIGKTTGIKILIHELLKKEDPKKIFYFNCDFTPDFFTFQKLIDEILNLKETFGISSAFLFLDEVTAVKDWWRVIKGYIELGKFKNDVLTVSGSSSLKLKKQAELFPGRRGFGKDVVVWPLTFNEFLAVHGLRLKLSGNLKKDFVLAKAYASEIEKLFKKYLMVGGFPLSINQDPRAKEYFLHSIENELIRADKNLNLVREIITSIFRKAPSPLNYSTIAKDTSGYSYKTVAEYLETMKNLFIIDYAYLRQDDKVVYRKEKKFFFIDPFIADCFSSLYGEAFLEAALYEWLVQTHLKRKYGEVYYFRNSYEIDCLARNLKIEVKAGKAHRKYPKGAEIIDKEDLPFFLVAIG
jgi:predicted AAA+ superfamily ATPase